MSVCEMKHSCRPVCRVIEGYSKLYDIGVHLLSIGEWQGIPLLLVAYFLPFPGINLHIEDALLPRPAGTSSPRAKVH